MCVFSSFLFKQKTAYEMRISDWSSDVCSSDLLQMLDGARAVLRPIGRDRPRSARSDPGQHGRRCSGEHDLRSMAPAPGQRGEHGDRRGDRTSVVSGKSVSVRVDLCGRRTIQKKKFNLMYINLL